MSLSKGHPNTSKVIPEASTVWCVRQFAFHLIMNRAWLWKKHPGACMTGYSFFLHQLCASLRQYTCEENTYTVNHIVLKFRWIEVNRRHSRSSATRGPLIWQWVSHIHPITEGQKLASIQSSEFFSSEQFLIAKSSFDVPSSWKQTYAFHHSNTALPGLSKP